LDKLPNKLVYSYPNIEIMNRVLEILREQGRTQAYLSREMGKSQNTINNWCRNITQPTLPQAKRLAELLGCEITDLLIDEDTTEEKK
jgi:transcriptional regulator with XRE-family HTH domain